MKKILMLVLLALLVKAGAQSVTLGWDRSCKPVNGYKIYYGQISNVVYQPYTYNNCYGSNTVSQTVVYSSFDHVIDAGNTNSIVISNLVVGATYCFAATAYDTNVESDFSASVAYFVDTPNLDVTPPTEFRVY